MGDIDFSQFPVTQDMIHNSELDNDASRIVWLQMTREEAAVALAEMHLMCKAALSDNLVLRRRAKTAANFYHSYIGKNVNVMAAAQAKSNLNISERRLAQLFAHKEVLFGGANLPIFKPSP